jgi:hypothetical protein
MHLVAPNKDPLKLLLALMVHLALKILAPMVLLLVPQRRKEFYVSSLKVYLLASMWVVTMRRRCMHTRSMLMRSS